MGRGGGQKLAISFKYMQWQFKFQKKYSGEVQMFGLKTLVGGW
jgi:hypothetical protein